jgi:hemolysin activation/secretion protein
MALAALATTPIAARAQTPPPRPAIPNSLHSSPLPAITPRTTPNLGAGLPNFTPPSSNANLPKANIQVGSVTIVGATAFPPAQLNTLTAGLAGQNVSLDKLEATRRNLVGLYREHGFVLSTVSMNIDAQGDVQFIVTEGHIVSVKLSKDIGPAGTMVLGFLDHLTAERPISEASLERWLLLAQQVPGVAVHAVLQADSDDPGALTLVAEVSKQSVSALVTADDRGFSGTGPAEGLAVVDLNSVTSFGDQSEISMFHTSGNTDNFGQASESFFIGTHGLRIKLYGGAGRAWPSGSLAGTDTVPGYESQLQVFGAQLTYPVLLRRNQSLNVALHFDAVQSVIHDAGVLTSNDSLRTARFAGQYAWQDLWAGDTRDGLSTVNLQESQGLPILGASADGRGVPPAGRLYEKIDFWKLNGSIGRTQTLFTPFPDATVALRVEAGGQFTNDVLPTEEEFDLGGIHYTRGFYSGQVAGDNAAYATAELQLNTGTSFILFNQPFDLGAQFYGFYDWGETWTNHPAGLPANEPGLRLESAGGGVRLGLTRYVELDGEAVERLTTNLDPGSPSTLPLSETVLYWGVTARY